MTQQPVTSIERLAVAAPAGDAVLCELHIARSSDGKVQIRLDHPQAGRLSAEDDSLFGALVQLRLSLEQQGLLLLCNAARKDTYPSRMSLQMGGGRQIYRLIPGRQAHKADLVDALEPATVDQVGTVAEQRFQYENWIRSLT